MRVAIPSPLRSYTGGRAEVEAHGGSLAALMSDLETRHPGIRFRMIDEQDRIRPHILVYVNGQAVRALDRPIGPGDDVRIVAALSGG